MFVISNFLVALANVLEVGFSILYWLILIRAVISWVNPDPENSIVQFLHQVTEPILYPIRKIMPFSFRYGIDISPIIAFLAIIFIKSFLIRTLLDLGMRLK